MASLKEHGRRATLGRRLDLLQYLLHGERPRLRVSGLAVEGAELAVGDAHVRVVGIGVDDERDLLLRVHAEPQLLGEAAEVEEGSLGEEPPAVGAVEPLARFDLGPDLREHA